MGHDIRNVWPERLRGRHQICDLDQLDLTNVKKLRFEARLTELSSVLANVQNLETEMAFRSRSRLERSRELECLLDPDSWGMRARDLMKMSNNAEDFEVMG